MKTNKIKEQTSLSSCLPAGNVGHLPLKKGEVFKKTGFTLVELLVVISIISILTVVTVGSFVESQKKSRDSARKANLKSLSTALNQYYADKGYFPCGVGTTCINGLIATEGEFSSGGIVYMKKVPSDKTSIKQIVYSLSPTKKAFRLYTNLENSKDGDCVPGGCGTTYSTTVGCCYAVTSSNVGVTGNFP